ncbi:MAG: type II toxin-antitoxin system RelE/ParE family toxin [Balneolaceae bacterium]
MRFQYHPEASRELTRSIKYYEEKSEGLGAEFLDEVEHAIAQVLTHPDSGTLLTDDDRRVLLSRFPFGIIYEVSEDLLTITAIMHLRRNPDYWKLRK